MPKSSAGVPSQSSAPPRLGPLGRCHHGQIVQKEAAAKGYPLVLPLSFFLILPLC